MKRRLCVLTSICLLLCVLLMPCAALVTEATPPLTADEATLVWSYVPGTSYLDAPSVPV